MRRVVIILLSVGVLAVLFVVLCTFVKRPYESVVLNRFGNLVKDEDQVRIVDNWYLKSPFDTLVRMDKRIHLFTNPLQQVPTAGSETITVRTFAAWRIHDPVLFYKTTQALDTKAEQLLGQKISGIVQAKISSHHLDDIFNTDESKVKTSEIETEVAAEVSKAVSDQGLEIVQIGFSRMGYPPTNANAVYQRMANERAQSTARYQAEGQGDSVRIEAEGNNQATQIRAGAVAEAEKIRGQGDAEALQILEKVQQTKAAADFYQYWKSLEVMKTSFTKNTYLVLPTDSPLLTPLFSGSPAAPTTQPAAPSTPGALGMARPVEGVR